MNATKKHKQKALMLSILCFSPLCFAIFQSAHWLKIEPPANNNPTISIAQFIAQSITEPTPQPIQTMQKPKPTQQKPIKKPKPLKKNKSKNPAPPILQDTPKTFLDATQHAQAMPSTEQLVTYRGNHNDSFLKAIKLAIDRAITYPRQARQMQLEGEVLVEFLWTKSQLLKDIKIVKSSGHKILDKSAIKTIKKASLNFPTHENDARLQIPIVYRLEN